MASKKTRAKRSSLPSVGDRVRFTFGVSQWDGLIVEDRGPIGDGGRQLFRVRFPLHPKYEGEEQFTELPANELVIIKTAA